MTTTITIETINAAFDDSKDAELARILRTLSMQIDDNGHPAILFDINGNRVGSVSYDHE